MAGEEEQNIPNELVAVRHFVRHGPFVTLRRGNLVDPSSGLGYQFAPERPAARVGPQHPPMAPY